MQYQLQILAQIFILMGISSDVSQRLKPIVHILVSLGVIN